MTDDRWEQFTEDSKTRFKDVIMMDETWSEEHGDEIQTGTQNVVEFTLPGTGDRFRVVRENRPLVLEKKLLYSHRQGDTAQTKYVLSDTEFSHKLRVYKEDDYGEWQEVTAGALGL
ncbi:MAG TPA: hypothetical protein VHQ41_01110 [Patescibacteria group bacterium]|jgi:hypothetical protein|nr:hypothetical protein [Patescibacteria group bacterium]